ncbi:putative gustatory receptor 59d [Drosophila biarmipes]|uniref:putative gustatory receptor 59d n=1 Tax=Drosophila biarmipes TaxID=125945 RepID=UPI0007E679F0|nr:putative gustatory receptor 59d [Drosophila biarmipes]
MHLVDSFRRQYSPEILPYCRRSIACKFFCASAVETLQGIICLSKMRKGINISAALGILGFFNLSLIIQVIILHYFNGMAYVRGRYTLLKKDLEAVIAETRFLNPNRIGVFVTTCCSLADRLEEIAQAQSDLQALIERLPRTYQVQIVCFIYTAYSSLLANVYAIFTLHKYGVTEEIFPNFIVVTYTAHLVMSLADFWINAYNLFSLLDAHEEMIKLLSEISVLQSALDQRLEAVITNFTLNLVRHPMRLQFLGFFDINRSAAFAMLNSLLSQAIILIQIDIQNK